MLTIEQMNCALINDCWVHGVYDIDAFDSPLIAPPSGSNDSIGLRVLRSKRFISGQPSTVMLLHNTEDQQAVSNETVLCITGAVILPFLGKCQGSTLVRERKC